MPLLYFRVKECFICEATRVSFWKNLCDFCSNFMRSFPRNAYFLFEGRRPPAVRGKFKVLFYFNTACPMNWCLIERYRTCSKRLCTWTGQSLSK